MFVNLHFLVYKHLSGVIFKLSLCPALRPTSAFMASVSWSGSAVKRTAVMGSRIALGRGLPGAKNDKI